MTSPAPVSYPLGAPTLSGTTLTVDTALKQPGRITKRIADLTLQKFIVDRIFSSSGTTVAAGAVIYDQTVANELYLSREPERRMPGDEYPIVGGPRRAPKVATSEDWGGKFFVTDEAVRRNDRIYFDQQVTMLGNTLVRRVNTQAIAQLEAAITALGGAGTIVGVNWGAVVTGGSSQSNNSLWPAADFVKAQVAADVDELGVTYDLWIVNPAQKGALETVYGADLGALLASYGIELFASNRVPAGTAYAVARGQVGFLDYEQGLTTETWREQKTKRNWVQTSVMPIMGITNPYSIKKFTGLAG
jgi:hypothetical protein